jgi:Zn-dependent metalloprotease
MKTLHVITIIILFPVVALSQSLERIGNKGEAQRNNKNEIGFYKSTTNAEAITNKNDFFIGVLNIAKTDEYRFQKKGDSEKGRHFEVYHQYFGGVPVKDGVYVLHWENGKLESANGNYIRINKLNPKPTLTEKEVFDIWLGLAQIPDR